ncbi:Acetoacetyl-CoA synthetase [leucine] (plasmid) [Cupriavidus taiwanensis]|uniref:Acetoacetyl-CoA synthetase [leucine] n=1 Tax=Cupriavidus taiwanensis TaxID=164546 RepID=A0A9Q7UYA4_9BURK|nr:AMP-binding protein [Cupriavidus taiwanensis]SPD66837.1 Acetoacetyl-CoA synthetase [leucine] [Cupriavidus taiwanensis]
MNHLEETILDVIRRRAFETPDSVALIFEGGETCADVEVTYAALWDRIQAVGRGLKHSGLTSGDRCATLMANHLEFIELLFACSLIGVTLVPIDPRTRGEKLAFMLAQVNATALVSADYSLPHFLEVLDESPALTYIAVLATGEKAAARPCNDSLRDFTDFYRDGDEIGYRIDPDAPMEILFTSGTTGDPKGIVMTHKRYFSTSRAAFNQFGYVASDRLYTGLSLTHANAQIATLGAGIVGGLSIVISRRFTKTRLWDITRRFACTSFTLLGGMTTAVYAEPPRDDDAMNPVRLVVSAGMPESIWRRFESRFGVQVLEFYGAAEGGLAVNPPGVGPVGSCGRLGNDFIARIVDETGEPVMPGALGELLIGRADGSPVTVEYVGAPEASKLKCAGGWLHMGDIVRTDADGWIFFSHRKGGGIRRNGDFVNTAFIERVIADSGLVDDVYVYGIDAASKAPGEKDIVAAVVPSRIIRFDLQKLINICRDTLEANFVPVYIHVMENIPKTASEKPQDRLLIADFEKQPRNVFPTEKYGR